MEPELVIDMPPTRRPVIVSGTRDAIRAFLDAYDDEHGRWAAVLTNGQLTATWHPQ